MCETKAANSSSHTGCHSFLGFFFFLSTTSISGTVSTTTILFFGEVEGFYPVQKKRPVARKPERGRVKTMFWGGIHLHQGSRRKQEKKIGFRGRLPFGNEEREKKVARSTTTLTILIVSEVAFSLPIGHNCNTKRHCAFCAFEQERKAQHPKLVALELEARGDPVDDKETSGTLMLIQDSSV